MRKLTFLPLLFLFSCGSEPRTNVEILDDNNEAVDSIIEIEVDSIPLLDVPAVIDFTAYENIAFGFADLDGDSLILIDKPEALEGKEFTSAFSSNGHIKLNYLGHQTSNENDNNRLNAYNFKNLEGELFQVDGQPAPLWEAVLFVPTDFIQARKHLAKTSVRELSRQERVQIEADKGRSLKKSEHIASFAEGSLYFTEFDKKGDSVLVSVVWIGEEENVYLDFPAEYNEMSTWRVDDGGQFDFEYYKIIAVFKSDQGIEMVTDWVGAEGSSVNYFLGVNGKFESVKSTYFYSAPL